MNHPLITLIMLYIYIKLSSPEYRAFSSHLRSDVRSIAARIQQYEINRAKREYSLMVEHPCKETMKKIIDSVELVLLCPSLKTQHFFNEFDKKYQYVDSTAPITLQSNDMV